MSSEMEIKISMLVMEVKGLKQGHIFKNTPFYISFVLLAHLSQWLMVSYCDRWMSVLRCPPCVVKNCFKGHLLLNYWLDFNQTW